MSQTNNSPQIFLVDDDPVIATSLGLLLQFQGFNVVSFIDPFKALEAAQTNAPDLLITDVVMPGFSGVDLAVTMFEICPDCKVMLFSGHPATAEMLETARTNGHYFEVLAKPVHPKEPVAKVRLGLGLHSCNEQN